VNFRFTESTGGGSTGAYLSRNLALHVGDQPETVRSNRRSLSDEINLPVQFMEQVHGNHVEVINDLIQPSPTADALVTTNPKMALAVMVADCIPLLLANQGSVAAVHVGRKGLLNGVSQKAIVKMRELDSSPISAVMGPSICGRCYEVSPDIYAEVTHVFPRAASETSQGTPSLDLAAALSFELEKIDIDVLNLARCTMEDLSFYSYRRDGVTGRQAGVIWL
jgi:YfiH family protein